MSRRPGSDLHQALAAAPVTCSLDTDGVRTQEQRWAGLIATAGTARAATTDGVALTFRSDPHVERELRELVAVENDCCAWAHWEVEADGGDGLVMHARTRPDQVAVLQSMF